MTALDEYEVTRLAAGDSHDASLTSQVDNSVSGCLSDLLGWPRRKFTANTYDECEVKLPVLPQCSTPYSSIK